MKNISTYLISVVFVLLTGPAWAGSVTIPNTFTSGTKAMAADVNANFSAVKTAVDDNATSIAGKVNKAGDTMTGDLTAPDFKYDSSQTRYYVLGINDFVPFNATYTYSRNDSGLNPSSAGAVYFFAPIHLPDGATITSVDVYTSDNSTTSYLSWYLREHYLVSGTLNVMVANASGNAAAAPGSEDLSITGLTHVIDNSQYYYQLRLWFTDGAQSVTFHSARITYTVAKPD